MADNNEIIKWRGSPLREKTGTSLADLGLFLGAPPPVSGPPAAPPMPGAAPLASLGTFGRYADQPTQGGVVDLRRGFYASPPLTPRVDRVPAEIEAGPMAHNSMASEAYRQTDANLLKAAFTGGNEPTVPHGEYADDTAFRGEVSGMLQNRPATATPEPLPQYEEMRRLQESVRRQLEREDRELLWQREQQKRRGTTGTAMSETDYDEFLRDPPATKARR